MTTGTTAAIQLRNAENVDLLTTDFQRRAEPQFALKSMIAQFLAIPGLRAFWPLSSVDENGDAFDLSGQARTLGYNGNPVYDFDNLVPCIQLDGTGDYLDRADEAGLDILGTESYIAESGLTMGCWTNFRDAGGADDAVLGKANFGTNNRSYIIRRDATDVFRAYVSVDGTAATIVDTTETYTQDLWHFVAMRFTPSTELGIFMDGEWDLNTTSIPASIFNSNADFNVGADNNGGAHRAEAWFSMAFLSAVAVSDAIIGQLWEQTRVAFGRL